MRFCYVTSGSRTPKRYECQPDLVERAVLASAQQDNLTTAQRNSLLAKERARVEPEFNNTRYGTPTYCQLSDHCAAEITSGADDESEMGVFHDLYQPQRATNLRARLDEYTPAGMTAGIIYAS
jgi:monoamine oxidase